MTRPAHNPKAPYRRRRRRQTGIAEVSPRDQFVGRLEALGADREIIEQTIAAWDDPSWTNRDQIVALDDNALRGEIEAIFAEHEFHTTDPDDVSEGGVPDGTVAEIVEWIGGDPGRAEAALSAERGREKPRAGVVSIAESIIGAG